MKVLNDYKCTACEQITEHLEKPEIQYTTCPICGEPAVKLIPAPHFDYLHMGRDPYGLPTAGDKWANMHKKTSNPEED